MVQVNGFKMDHPKELPMVKKDKKENKKDKKKRKKDKKEKGKEVERIYTNFQVWQEKLIQIDVQYCETEYETLTNELIKTMQEQQNHNISQLWSLQESFQENDISESVEQVYTSLSTNIEEFRKSMKNIKEDDKLSQYSKIHETIQKLEKEFFLLENEENEFRQEFQLKLLTFKLDRSQQENSSLKSEIQLLKEINIQQPKEIIANQMNEIQSLQHEVKLFANQDQETEHQFQNVKLEWIQQLSLEKDLTRINDEQRQQIEQLQKHQTIWEEDHRMQVEKLEMVMKTREDQIEKKVSENLLLQEEIIGLQSTITGLETAEQEFIRVSQELNENKGKGIKEMEKRMELKSQEYEVSVSKMKADNQRKAKENKRRLGVLNGQLVGLNLEVINNQVMVEYFFQLNEKLKSKCKYLEKQIKDMKQIEQTQTQKIARLTNNKLVLRKEIERITENIQKEFRLIRFGGLEKIIKDIQNKKEEEVLSEEQKCQLKLEMYIWYAVRQMKGPDFQEFSEGFGQVDNDRVSSLKQSVRGQERRFLKLEERIGGLVEKRKSTKKEYQDIEQTQQLIFADQTQAINEMNVEEVAQLEISVRKIQEKLETVKLQEIYLLMEYSGLIDERNQVFLILSQHVNQLRKTYEQLITHSLVSDASHIQKFSRNVNELETSFQDDLLKQFTKIFKVKNRIRTIGNKKSLADEKIIALFQMQEESYELKDIEQAQEFEEEINSLKEMKGQSDLMKNKLELKLIDLEKEKFNLIKDKNFQKRSVLTGITDFRSNYERKFSTFYSQEESLVKFQQLIIQKIWQILDENSDLNDLLFISKTTTKLNGKVLLVEHLQRIVQTVNQKSNIITAKTKEKYEMMQEFDEKFQIILQQMDKIEYELKKRDFKVNSYLQSATSFLMNQTVLLEQLHHKNEILGTLTKVRNEKEYHTVLIEDLNARLPIMRKIQQKRIQWKNYTKAKEISDEIAKIEAEIVETGRNIPGLEGKSLVLEDSLYDQEQIYGQIKLENSALETSYIEEYGPILSYEESDLNLLLGRAYSEKDKKNIAVIGLEINAIQKLKQDGTEDDSFLVETAEKELQIDGASHLQTPEKKGSILQEQSTNFGTVDSEK